VASTPAVELLVASGTAYSLHEYAHDPRQRAFGSEAAVALGVEPDRVFKTLVATVPEGLVVAIVPVSTELDLKALAHACGAKRATMADPKAAERSSGYVVGGISPLGQKRRLVTVVDLSATRWPTVFVSGGRRGLEIELTPNDLVALTAASLAPIGRDNHTR